MISLGACVAFLYRTRRSALLTPWERQEMADQVSETLDSGHPLHDYDVSMRMCGVFVQD